MQTIGDYDILEKIADGGMGSVYKARAKGATELVALKILPAHMAKNPVMIKRFEQEYSAAKQLQHANLVRALDFGYEGPSPFIVMELVEGETLGQRLERDKQMPETDAIRLIAQVAQGLHKAHKMGLVHRDVKPDNILLTPDGKVKLTDMGLVKEIEAELDLTRTGRGLGTPHFMAPEQFRNAKDADARCDIYSMAATLYMMVTGEMPFKSLGPLEAWMKKIENKYTPPRELIPTLSERIDWAIRRAMHSDPNNRPSSCREFVEDLTGRSTRRLPNVAEKVVQDIWYLRYHDEDGVMHALSATMASVRRSLKDGYLGDAANVRAARDPSGPFEALRNYPEFRDVVMAAVVTAAPKKISTSRQKSPRAAPSRPSLSPEPRRRPPLPPVPSTPNRADLGAPLPNTNTHGDADAEDETDIAYVPRINFDTPDSQQEFNRVLLIILFAFLTVVSGVLAFLLLFK